MTIVARSTAMMIALRTFGSAVMPSRVLKRRASTVGPGTLTISQLGIALDDRDHADRNGRRNHDIDATGLQFGNGVEGSAMKRRLELGELRRAAPVVGIGFKRDVDLRLRRTRT